MARSGTAVSYSEALSKFTFSHVQQWLYVHNGFRPMYSWSPVYGSFKAGTPEPTIAPTASNGAVTGSISEGNHFIRYRYRNSRTGYVGNSSEQITHYALGSQALELVLPGNTDARLDQVVVEMTEAEGTEFYVAAYVTNNAYTSTGNPYELLISDDSLSVNPIQYPTRNDFPPYGRSVVHTRGYSFVGGPVDFVKGATSSCTITTNAGTGIYREVVLTGVNQGDPTTLYESPYIFYAAGYGSPIVAASTQEGSQITLTLSDELGTFLTTITGAQDDWAIYPQNPNRIYVSQSLHPEAFNLSSRYFTALLEKSDRLAALHAYGQGLLVFGQHNTEFLQWAFDPVDLTDGRIGTISDRRGAISQECVCELDDIVYAFDLQGAHMIRDMRSIDMSEGIRMLLPAVDWTKKDEFHVVADPEELTVHFFVCMGQEDYPQTAFVYHVPTGRWSTHYYDYQVTCSTIAFDGQNMRPVFGLMGSAPVYSRIGYTDGAPWGAGSRKGTITSASTTAITFSSATAPPATWTTDPGGDYVRGNWIVGETDGYLRRRGYQNASAYWREGDECSTIQSVYGNIAYFAPAFSSAPAVGDTIDFGRIWSILKTKKYSMAPNDTMRAATFSVHFTPLPYTAYLYMRIFEDDSTAPKSDWVDNTEVNGVEFVADDPYIKINLKNPEGVAHVPIQITWKTAIQFELSLRDALTPLRLHRFAFTADVEDDFNGF